MGFGKACVGTKHRRGQHRATNSHSRQNRLRNRQAAPSYAGQVLNCEDSHIFRQPLLQYVGDGLRTSRQMTNAVSSRGVEDAAPYAFY